MLSSGREKLPVKCMDRLTLTGVGSRMYKTSSCGCVHSGPGGQWPGAEGREVLGESLRTSSKCRGDRAGAPGAGSEKPQELRAGSSLGQARGL